MTQNPWRRRGRLAENTSIRLLLNLRGSSSICVVALAVSRTAGITCPVGNAGSLMSDENQLRLGAGTGPTDLGR